jgi:hypothetical protein
MMLLALLSSYLVNKVLHSSLQPPPAEMHRYKLIGSHIGTVTVVELFLHSKREIEQTNRGRNERGKGYPDLTCKSLFYSMLDWENKYASFTLKCHAAFTIHKIYGKIW